MTLRTVYLVIDLTLDVVSVVKKFERERTIILIAGVRVKLDFITFLLFFSLHL